MKQPTIVTLTLVQARALAVVLDAGTVQTLAEARDALRRAFGLPPFELKD